MSQETKIIIWTLRKLIFEIAMLINLQFFQAMIVMVIAMVYILNFDIFKTPWNTHIDYLSIY